MKYIINSIHYDSKNDILNLKFGNMDNSYGDEDIDNVIWMKDIETDDITGLTIIDFLEMVMQNDKRIEELKKYINLNYIIKKVLH